MGVGTHGSRAGLTCLHVDETPTKAGMGQELRWPPPPLLESVLQASGAASIVGRDLK